MEVFIAYLVAGIVSGSIYSLIGIGMNLLLVVSRVVQFAYGEIVVISMYTCWLIHKSTGSFILAFFGSAVISVALTVLIEPILRGLRERKLLTETLVITIAVGMILTEVMSQFLNSGLPIAFPMGNDHQDEADDNYYRGDHQPCGVIPLGENAVETPRPGWIATTNTARIVRSRPGGLAIRLDCGAWIHLFSVIGAKSTGLDQRASEKPQVEIHALPLTYA